MDRRVDRFREVLEPCVEFVDSGDVGGGGVVEVYFELCAYSVPVGFGVIVSFAGFYATGPKF